METKRVFFQFENIISVLVKRLALFALFEYRGTYAVGPGPLDIF